MAIIKMNGFEIGVIEITKEDIKRYEEAGFVVIIQWWLQKNKKIFKKKYWQNRIKML